MPTLSQPDAPPHWLTSAAALLTLRRIRAHAIILALCLWGACAVDFSTPGIFDRAGNIKFQDFLPFYISAHLISQGRASEIYNQQTPADEMQAIIHQPTRVRLPYLYGPQVALPFVPLSHLSFPVAARTCVALSLLIFFICIYLIWKSCPSLQPYPAFVAISAIAYPPLFHFFVRAQVAVLVLVCFTAAFLAFRAQHSFLAGIALGFLIFKPQFLVAIPLILLLARAGKPLAALILSAGSQLALAEIYFGSSIMRAYFDTLLHSSRWLTTAEPGLAPIQMHSLRSFWSLLVPWPQAAFGLYVTSSIAVITLATVVWKSSSPLSLRFSALTLAAILVNPHLFIYDLLALVPALLLLADWTLIPAQQTSTPALRLLIYLAFLLPLFGPLSQWTHLQLSVPAFVALLWTLHRTNTTQSHKLATSDCPVV